MKYFIFLITLSSIVACSSPDKASVKGTLTHAKALETAYLHKITATGTELVDSSEINKKGKFLLTTPLSSPGFYQLSMLSGQKLTLILLPGETLRFESDMNDFYTSKSISGSPNTERLSTLHDSLRLTVLHMRALEKAYHQIDTVTPESLQKRVEINAQYEATKKGFHKYSLGFILDDLKSLANVAALYQEYAPGYFVFHNQHDLQYFKLATDTLSKYYPEVGMVKNLRANYENFYNRYSSLQLLKNAKVREGGLHQFSLPDVQGTTLTMNQAGSRYLLLSFWSQGHEASVQNNLEMLPLYKKYHTKGFEIYQVGLSATLEPWKSAVRFENYPWISVCDTAYPNSASRLYYNVTALPTNYLIDMQKQEVLARNLDPKKLDNTLNHLLNQ